MLAPMADQNADADADALLELDTYAALRARLAVDGVDRNLLLSEKGLDEEGWERIDELWQQRFSDDLEQGQEDVPASVLRYSEVFAATQRDAPAELLSLELFATCTRKLQRSRDPKLALEKLGVTLSQFLKANQHWAAWMATDKQNAERFHRIVSGLLPK